MREEEQNENNEYENFSKKIFHFIPPILTKVYPPSLFLSITYIKIIKKRTSKRFHFFLRLFSSHDLKYLHHQDSYQ